MKKIYLTLIIFLIIAAIASLHIYKTLTITNDIFDLSEEIFSLYEDESWNEIDSNMSRISDIWHKNRLWACLTLPTSQVDEIEISLEQSIEFSKIRAKADFIGEFKMFCLLIEHLPKQESFSIEELL